MRAGIAALPDGTYRFTDTYDNPELGRPLPVSVEITIEGSEMRLHFESPAQVRAGINMIYTALLSSVYYAVKAVVDPTILPNSGLARPATGPARPLALPATTQTLGLSRNHRRRLRRARPKGWVRRCRRPHDQHLKPAGRSA